MQTSRRAAVAVLLAAIVAGCSTSDQVIVRDSAEPYNFEAAQLTANQQCAARGFGRAQLVMVLNNAASTGGTQSTGPGPPDIIYRCQPR
jgi:hypothetical protein